MYNWRFTTKYQYDLDVGDNILVRNLELPENVQCYLDPRVPVVGIIKAK